MWPIFFLAMFSLAVVLEKISYNIFRLRDLNSKFKVNIFNILNAQDLEKIATFCQKYKNPLAKVINSSFEFYKKTEIYLKMSMNLL